MQPSKHRMDELVTIFQVTEGKWRGHHGFTADRKEARVFTRLDAEWVSQIYPPGHVIIYTVHPFHDGARDGRQVAATEWCASAFGRKHATSLPARAIRFLEEAIELYQAAGGEREMARRLLDHVFNRPVGDIHQEIGGVGITLLVLAAAAGLSADQEEARELQRVVSKPLDHFAARNRAKNEAGFDPSKQPEEALS